MSFQSLLLVGYHPELSSGLKESFPEESGISCVSVDQADSLDFQINNGLPDLILLFANVIKDWNLTAEAFCQHLYELTPEYRSVLIVYADEAEEDERIQWLQSGADDVFSTSMSTAELRARVLAHLRRNLEFLCHPQTHLPGLPLISKALQRCIRGGNEWALLVIEVDSFTVYSEIYGDIPSRKVRLAIGGILLNLVRPPDLMGHTDTDTFVIITHPDKAPKLAALLCKQFEVNAPNFYSEKDRKAGFLVEVIDRQLCRRVPLLSLKVGIVSSRYRPFNSFQQAFTAATEMKNLARMSPGNAWVNERLRLTGSPEADMPLVHERTKRVLIIESDAALAFLLKSALEMQGFEAITVSNRNDAQSALSQGDAEGRPAVDLVLMDAIIQDQRIGWEFCQQIKSVIPNIHVVFLSTLDARDEALAAGADLYMPKPFELVPLLLWIDQLLRR